MSLSYLTAKKQIPAYVFFELTRHCNLKCLHCYVVRQKKPELSTAKVKEIINQLRTENSLILNFSGGEVFTRNDFFNIARHAKDMGFAIKIFTNGTLIDKYKAKEIAELKPLRVEVTVFSTKPNIHDAITGLKGSLEKSIKALTLLSKERVPLRIKSPLMKQNASGYTAIINLAKDLGAKYQFDPAITPKTDGSRSPINYRINKKELLRIFNDPEISTAEEIIPRRNNLPCSAGHNSCAISAYGDVLPCIILPIKLGNLMEEGFSDIWHNSHGLRKFRSIRHKDLRDCQECNLLFACNRCPGLAYLEDGDVLGKSKRACEIAEARSKFIN